jgi:flagellar hook-associated protein 1 FlgK
MGNGLFGIGISGLSAAQAGLATTGHNITNAGTAGFHRQEVVQQNAPGHYSGAGFIGQGVQVDTVRRIYSDFLDAQASRANAQASYYTAYVGQISQIDTLLSDPSAGLAPELQRFFEGVNELAANPGSVPSRQSMLSAGESLVARMNSLDARLVEMNRGVNAQIESTVSRVNAYATEIAKLNGQLAATQGSAQHPPNDLLDQRELMIAELNALVGVTTLKQADGAVSVSIGTGQSLVVGQNAFRVAATPSLDTPGRTELHYVIGSTTMPLPTQAIGGSLGAVLAFRAGPLTDTQNQLGRIAAGLALTFNEQHRLGNDLRGAAGGDFFVPLTTTVTDRTGNTGTADIDATVVSASALQPSSYQLRFTGGAYQLTRLSDNTTTAFAVLPQTIDGLTITLAGGAPANGDSFLIEPTRYAARDLALAFSDPALIAAAAPMRTGSALANNGTGAISAGVANAPRDVNVQQPVTITFTSATTFDVTGVGTGNPVGVAFTAGANITYNGWTVQISGAPATGDTFTIASNTNGTADNRNAARLADLQLANTLNGGTVSYQGAFGQLTSQVGNTTRQIEISSEAQDTILIRAREAQQAVSGVNLDEEAANLLRYQQAFQASGKVIEVAATVFDTILSLGR